MKSLPMIVEPVYDNDSKVVSRTDIPVPIPSVRSAGPLGLAALPGGRYLELEHLGRRPAQPPDFTGTGALRLRYR
jgi:hypothetical protein